MGQTLTHGIYLPDEGERNCYDGLASNWSILDGAVGTVAEHSTQIAGKAPAVHTHTKADITDLFNSANEWTQINTYTVALRFSAANYSAGTPSSDIFYGSLQWGGIVNNSFVQSFGINNAIRTTGINDISLRVWSQTGSTLRGVAVETNADASNSSLRPLVNNVTDLGSSIYQWNNLYAKNYYYNGVAWGLDKANVWSAENTYTSILLTLKHTALEAGVLPASNQTKRYHFTDKNNVSLGWLQHRVNTSGDSYLEIYSVNKFSNGQLSPQGSGIANSLIVGLHSDGTRYAQVMSDLYPANTNLNCNLGTSNNPWKSLNGVNPGALSLPGEDASSTNLDPTNWNTTGTQYNAYTPPSNGWLGIQVMSADTTDLTGQYLFAGRNTGGQDFWPQGQLVNLVGDFESNKLTGNIFFPVIANKQYQIRIKIGKTQTEGSIIRARFYPCLGNV